MDAWRIHYNQVHPHSALGVYQSRTVSSAGKKGCGKDGRCATLKNFPLSHSPEDDDSFISKTLHLSARPNWEEATQATNCLLICMRLFSHMHLHQESIKAVTLHGTGEATVTGVISPKQPAQLRHREWYPYYAGFTEAFVDSVIANQLREAKTIIDPWNGAGTTTVVCERRGVYSTGIDINPALTVIARARLTPVTQRKELNEICSEIISSCDDVTIYSVADDMLTTWIQPSAVQKIRKIQQAIHGTSARTTSSIPPNRIIHCADEFSHVTSFFYCALFGVVRNLLRKFRTTNPMWIKTPPTYASRIRPSWSTLSRNFKEQVDLLGCQLTVPTQTPSCLQASLITNNATKLPLPTASFDGAITSPPYATRIDYVRGMLPELALLGADETFLANLRRVVTGTPVVRNVSVRNSIALKSESGRTVLKIVSDHSSKGSSSYYLPWLRNYLQDLQSGIAEVARTVKGGGRICMVVQDSYYKEHRIDLQTIVVELMEASGRTLHSRADYLAPTPRSKVVQSKGKVLVRTTTETVLVFR